MGRASGPPRLNRSRLAIGSRIPGLGESGPRAALDRTLVLYFMRAAGCSICLEHVRELKRMSGEIGAMGAVVLVVQPGSLAASRKLADALGLPFAVASGAEVYGPIGLGPRALGAIRGSGTIVVDAEGIVRHARRAAFPAGAFDRVELLEALRATPVQPVERQELEAGGPTCLTIAMGLERISIEVTNRCAKACWFCYNHSQPEADGRWEPDDLSRFVLDCAANGVKAVSFGGGEPLQYEADLRGPRSGSGASCSGQ